MASAWVEKRQSKRGVRYRVEYRLGGRESRSRYAGTFSTMREARIRRDWVAGELAALRVPDLRLLEPVSAPLLRVVAERWRRSRVDVAESTAATHSVNLGRILPRLGDRPVDEITPDDIATFIGELAGLKRETVRKTLATLGMIFDFAGVQPNPARDRRTVKLPRETRAEVNPPTADHVVAVYRLLNTVNRTALLVLEATGMRVGELESLTWGDVDEPRRRWRVSKANAKTQTARWVPVPEVVFDHVMTLVPRDDRDLAAPVIRGFSADRLRTAIGRACRAAGVPAFSPHDLRHRRATLWHLSGIPPVEAASWLGHSPQEHLRTYAHAVVDRTDVALLVEGDGHETLKCCPSEGTTSLLAQLRT